MTSTFPNCGRLWIHVASMNTYQVVTGQQGSLLSPLATPYPPCPLLWSWARWAGSAVAALVWWGPWVNPHHLPQPLVSSFLPLSIGHNPPTWPLWNEGNPVQFWNSGTDLYLERVLRTQNDCPEINLGCSRPPVWNSTSRPLPLQCTPLNAQEVAGMID